MGQLAHAHHEDIVARCGMHACRNAMCTLHAPLQEAAKRCANLQDRATLAVISLQVLRLCCEKLQRGSQWLGIFLLQ